MPKKRKPRKKHVESSEEDDEGVNRMPATTSILIRSHECLLDNFYNLHDFFRELAEQTWAE